jgi:hypothetical protein
MLKYNTMSKVAVETVISVNRKKNPSVWDTLVHTCKKAGTTKTGAQQFPSNT